MLSKYRPICYVPIISQITEKCALVQIDEHLEQNNLLIKHQSAYKKYHSCETALLKVQNDLASTIDCNTNALLVLLDFSAAFDTIHHEKLFEKLRFHYRIDGTALKWFKSYAPNRKFRVKINQHLSNGTFMNCGVQQGSVMGPKVFSLYTQEIESIVTRHYLQYHIFADDIIIYSPLTKGFPELHLIKSCLEDITEWAKNNWLKLNDDKTKFVEIKCRQSNLSLGSLNIWKDDSCCDSYAKSLGVVIDETLSFKNQITQVCRKGFGMLRQLWHISGKLKNVTLRIQLVHSCILSNIDYCNSLYLGLPQKQIKKLQRLLNAAVRFIYCLPWRRIHITPYLKQAHILPVNLRLRFKTCVMVHRCLNNAAPRYLADLIKRKVSLQSLRIYNDTTLLHVPKLEQQNYRNRRFEIAAPREWNILPKEIRDTLSIETFKTKLKTHLFNQF